jgi:ABC-type microcin C transport system duplicated ATPase subunit YejF
VHGTRRRGGCARGLSSSCLFMYTHDRRRDEECSRAVHADAGPAAGEVEVRADVAGLPAAAQARSCSMFVRLISHQLAVLFSQNKPVTSNQSTVLFSKNKSAPVISQQPNEYASGLKASEVRSQCHSRPPKVRAWTGLAKRTCAFFFPVITRTTRATRRKCAATLVSRRNVRWLGILRFNAGPWKHTQTVVVD